MDRLAAVTRAGRRHGRAVAACAVAALLAACGRASSPAGSSPRPGSAGKGTVSADRTTLRAEPSARGAVVATLLRGADVVVGRSEGAHLCVTRPGAPEAWIEASAVERAEDREARERRTAAVAKLPAVPGRMVAAAPVLLAPEWGAARWGALEEGDPVEVVVADNDFFGVRLLGIPLAFVPAQAVRFVPPPTPEPLPTPVPVKESAAASPGGEEIEVPVLSEPARGNPGREPYEALPAGAEPPAILRRVDPVYPEAARRMGLGGVVELRLVVERDGTVGRVDPIGQAPAPLVEAAVAAVRQWRYEPARLAGQPIAVEKLVRVTFRPTGG